MATTLKAIRVALFDVLTSADELVGWARAHFGEDALLHGFVGRQIGTIGDEEKPAILVGSGGVVETDEPAIGGGSTDKHVEIPFWFLWNEEDAEDAADQHDELNDILSRVVLRNAALGDANEVVLVTAEPTRTELPTQIHECAIRAQFTLGAAAVAAAA
jgi:hypothetical protein